ncbi:uncharacterized protein BDR25DRAFT_305622 [Lindgomyces ingoldianus]|uniref:Uncharacterized protein n=1 Tax=Lindgomyces ingoldianus TaxID=673940 RepID=A0ACB6QKR5_9PLEO|nr:uncharacterized protein BDR25DRAFT_305622 [Lindgomyces ingoldianus]KAF2467168.1 hypothetical protein BDR25DRAFT_305622 [Lindgomyces ingoldianus]
MARQRGGSAPRRPTAAPPKPAARAPAAPPARQSSTAAAPTQQQHAPPAQSAAPQQASQGPGLFANMASTAAGVAVGSSIGHAIGGFFSGGSSSAPAEQQSASTEFAQQHQETSTQNATGACATDINNFRKCMDENQGSLTICGWYLDQLKACQQAAGQY